MSAVLAGAMVICDSINFSTGIVHGLRHLNAVFGRFKFVFSGVLYKIFLQ